MDFRMDVFKMTHQATIAALALITLIAPMAYGYPATGKPFTGINTNTRGNWQIYRNIHVVNVIDGDTMDIEGLKHGEATRIRVYGLDTPELHPKRNKPEKCRLKEIALAEKAKARVEGLVEWSNGTVTLRIKHGKRGRFKGKPILGKYGRVLAHVYVGDVLLADALIYENLGREYLKGKRKGWC